MIILQRKSVPYRFITVFIIHNPILELKLQKLPLLVNLGSAGAGLACPGDSLQPTQDTIAYNTILITKILYNYITRY